MFVYQVAIKSPWDSEWKIYNPDKYYWTPLGARWKIRQLKKQPWVVEGTQFTVF